MSHPPLDLSDSCLAQRLQGHDLVLAAGAGSGKTFSLVALVLGFLGRPSGRAHEVLATTFSRESAADLRTRILQPLDALATLPEGAWARLLEAMGQDWAAWDREAAALGLRGESILAARQWPVDGAWPEWTLAPARARGHWARARREAEGLEVATVHGLALKVLQTRARGREEAVRELLDAEDPRLVGLLRRVGREGLALAVTDPDQQAARRLLAWLEGREGDEGRWERMAAAVDAHTDAMGRWREPQDLEEVRDAFWDQARSGLAAHRAFVEAPDRAAARRRDGAILANFEKHGRARFASVPLPDAADPVLLRFWERWFAGVPKEDGSLPNYYSTAYGEAMGEPLSALPALLEFWMTGLMEQVLRAFVAEKRARGWRTYGDLVRDAIDRLAGAPPDPAPRLLLVDEYQDINPVQDAFLSAFQAHATVRVGDRKQAIYGFRGGSADLLDARLAEASVRGDAYRLPLNHRSAAAVVATANAFVADIMPALDAGSADPDGVQVDTHGGHGVPSVAVIRVDSEKTRGTDLPAAADWVAALSQEPGWAALGSPWDAQEPRRRALLLPRRTGLPALRRLLQARGVEPLVVSQDGFWESPGPRAVVNLFECLVRPGRPLPLLALLRGPWFGLADPDLLRAAPFLAKGWRDLDGDKAPEGVRPALDWLNHLAGRSTPEVLAQALARPGLLESFPALTAHGRMEPDRARRNLDRLLGWGLALPAHLPSAWRELDRRRQRREGDAPPARTETPAALLIQTIHGSKGLEYEDVALSMLSQDVKGLRKGHLGRLPGTAEPALGWKLGRVPGPFHRALRREDALRAGREGLNLLYVGLTRARERMVLLQQWRVRDGVAEAPEAARRRAEEGLPVLAQHIAEDLAQGIPLPRLEAPPGAINAVRPHAPAPLAPPEPLPPVPGCAGDDADPERVRRRREGIALHALLRECLVRAASEPETLAGFLERSPLAAAWPGARPRVEAFLEALGERGWASLPRRTELPLPGGGMAGGQGFADLVIWEPERNAPACLHLVDFKLAAEVDPARLETYAAQLRGYARVLSERHPGVPVRAHIWSLEACTWVGGT